MKMKKLSILSLTLLLASCGAATDALATSKGNLLAAKFSFENELASLKSKVRIDSSMNDTKISSYNDGEYVSVELSKNGSGSLFNTYKFVEDYAVEETLYQDNEIQSFDYVGVLATRFMNPFADLDASKATIEGTTVTYTGSSLSSNSKEAFAFYLFDNEVFFEDSFTIDSISFTFSNEGNTFKANVTTSEITYASEEDVEKAGDETITTKLEASGSFSYGDNVKKLDHIIVKKAEEEDNASLAEAIDSLKKNNYTLKMVTTADEGSEETIVSTSNFYSNGKEAYYKEEGKVNTYSYLDDEGKWKLTNSESADEEDISNQLHMPDFSISKDCFKLDENSTTEKTTYHLKDGVKFNDDCLCSFDSDYFGSSIEGLDVILTIDSITFSYQEFDSEKEAYDTYQYIFSKIGSTENDFDPKDAITPSTLELNLGEEAFQNLVENYGNVFANHFPMIDALKECDWEFNSDEKHGDYLLANTLYLKYTDLFKDIYKSGKALYKAGYRVKFSGYYNDNLLDGYRIKVVPSYIKSSSMKRIIFKLSKIALN